MRQHHIFSFWSGSIQRGKWYLAANLMGILVAVGVSSNYTVALLVLETP